LFRKMTLEGREQRLKSNGGDTGGRLSPLNQKKKKKGKRVKGVAEVVETSTPLKKFKMFVGRGKLIKSGFPEPKGSATVTQVPPKN